VKPDYDGKIIVPRASPLYNDYGILMLTSHYGVSMTFLADTEIVLLTGVIVLFLTSLTGVIAVMSILRHRRHIQQDRALATVPGYSNGDLRPAEEVLERLREESSPTRPTNIPIPAHLRLPIQPGAADLEVIKIEPKPEKTQEQRNIERIIEYFKNETATPNAAVG
jgi:hypothetical protein